MTNKFSLNPLREFSPAIGFRHLSSRDLRFRKFVFSLMQIAWLSHLGMRVLKYPWVFHVPFVLSTVKHTIFRLFCGGETIQDAINILHILKSNGVSGILDFAAERGTSEAEFEKSFHSVLETIQAVSQFSGHRFAVFKPTSLVSFDLLHKISENISLSQAEKEAWARGVQRVESLCDSAVNHNVAIMADAEESWIQPAIDGLMEALMRKHNTQRTFVFTTIQFYRTGRVAELQRLISDAQQHNFLVGVKAVRGAYLEKERAFAAECRRPSPVHNSKKETDDHFNDGVALALKNLDRVAICVATHNEDSILSCIKKMPECSSAESDPKISFSQLYGMSDHITFCLAAAGLHASKYIPYGLVRETIPYLLRRAQENSAVQGQTAREVELLSREISRRRAPGPRHN